jgi:hypothetical protein
MLVLFLLLVIVAMALGIVGVVVKGLLPAVHRHWRAPRGLLPRRFVDAAPIHAKAPGSVIPSDRP